MGSAIAKLNQRITDRASVQGPTIRPDIICENYAAQVRKTPHPLSKQTTEHSPSGLQKEKENCESNAKPLSPTSALNPVKNKTISSHNDQNGSQIISDSNQNATNSNVSRTLEATTASKPNIRINSGINFIALKKRRNISYFIANIHTHVTDNDIYDYLTNANVKATQIFMYHGQNGSFAKVNISEEFQTVVENDDFWPERVTWCLWVNRRVWEQEKEMSRRRYKNKRSYQHSRVRGDHNYDDATDDIYGVHHNERAQDPHV
ncbi:hypothetical protein DPMN_007403 [Dreissena polymorpha]|uniref:Uncharacterized protein n=1 Tax=Dreissena polymorpha TaxID=45954 RepID=A0A9D4MVS8_DREPO|nr:hypothetical protein DPMN_007403 [Dreissena polymorpha]